MKGLLKVSILYPRTIAVLYSQKEKRSIISWCDGPQRRGIKRCSL
jgi:hypothetical protein